MPRTGRRRSSSGIYHVTSRGVGRLAIFEGDEDKLAFLNRVRLVLADERDVRLFAWVLMDNHLHFVVEDPHDTLNRFLARITGPYATRFNELHGHVGHVYQNRPHVVPVESDEQLLNTVRYVHQNPVRAGLSPDCDWPWSSYREYLGQPGLVCPDLVLEMLGGPDGFRAFHEIMPSAVETAALRKGLRAHVTDVDATAVVRELLGDRPLEQIGKLGRKERDAALRHLKAVGLTAKQIERHTGVGRGIIGRA
ncbi:transposase [Olsenella sp. YH-ols2217]|uniref:Transposase n=1 Tax=Kribbibacterium absianum TaxID=3044210 RepID=A0ABT6ZLW5_9ACTN|nr:MULTISPECIES: transposase [unclassified Olsenella]MDJ1122022.1 transposase [Olsenella sp. YH-ols2216]MDJ1130030.1 transposase [Olsenella sp. YH-ols2217]